MISDCQILGIEETGDLSLIKKAYRLRVKQLHPDTADNAALVENHFLFVEVCKAYRRLTEGGAACSGQSTSPRSSVKDKSQSSGTDATSANPAPGNGARQGAVIAHSDPAYVYYRKGMDIFITIHPSEWKSREKSVIQTEIGTSEADQREARRKAIDLVSLFPKAYYFFSTVVNEYPESIWASDARDKMAIIEGRMSRYRKIIESFSAWKEYRDAERGQHQNLARRRRH